MTIQIDVANAIALADHVAAAIGVVTDALRRCGPGQLNMWRSLQEHSRPLINNSQFNQIHNQNINYEISI